MISSFISRNIDILIAAVLVLAVFVLTLFEADLLARFEGNDIGRMLQSILHELARLLQSLLP